MARAGQRRDRRRGCDPLATTCSAGPGMPALKRRGHTQSSSPCAATSVPQNAPSCCKPARFKSWEQGREARRVSQLCQQTASRCHQHEGACMRASCRAAACCHAATVPPRTAVSHLCKGGRQRHHSVKQDQCLAPLLRHPHQHHALLHHLGQLLSGAPAGSTTGGGRGMCVVGQEGLQCPKAAGHLTEAELDEAQGPGRHAATQPSHAHRRKRVHSASSAAAATPSPSACSAAASAGAASLRRGRSTACATIGERAKHDTAARGPAVCAIHTPKRPSASRSCSSGCNAAQQRSLTTRPARPAGTPPPRPPPLPALPAPAAPAAWPAAAGWWAGAR